MALFDNKLTIQMSITLEFLLDMNKENPTLINNGLTIFHAFFPTLIKYIHLLDGQHIESVAYLRCSIFMKYDTVLGNNWEIHK